MFSGLPADCCFSGEGAGYDPLGGSTAIAGRVIQTQSGRLLVYCPVWVCSGKQSIHSRGDVF